MKGETDSGFAFIFFGVENKGVVGYKTDYGC